MFEKNLKFAYLLDFYGSLLDEHTEAVMKAYYDDDLSLSEVAEGVGISRQGVRHLVKRGEEQLEFYESRLSLAKRHAEGEELTHELRELKSELQNALGDGGKEYAERIDKIIDMVNSRN